MAGDQLISLTIVTLDANDVETSRIRIRHNGNGVPVIEP